MKELIALVNFKCVEDDCEEIIKFNIMGLKKTKGLLSCPHCHRQYQFNTQFIEKLDKLRNILFAIHHGEEILGDSNVAVTTPAGEVKVPYRLLLTRLNSILTLEIENHKVDFSFRIEPTDGSFR
jgi:hypothetical protein